MKVIQRIFLRETIYIKIFYFIELYFCSIEFYLFYLICKVFKEFFDLISIFQMHSLNDKQKHIVNYKIIRELSDQEFNHDQNFIQDIDAQCNQKD